MGVCEAASDVMQTVRISRRTVESSDIIVCP
jgi:hypothetical protein